MSMNVNCSVNYGAQYYEQTKAQGGPNSVPPPPPPQQANVVSGNLAIDNINEVSIKNNIQSMGVSQADKVVSLEKYAPSRTYITFKNERNLGFYGQPKLQAVENYNRFIAQNAYRNDL